MRGIAFACVGSIHDKLMPTLRRLVSERGAPRYLRSDNGPEFVARALLEWIVDQGIETALIDPGKPWQNGVSESFNGKFRDECLSMEWFLSRAQAKAIIEAWRRHYNEVRPHSSLGYLTPAEFAAKSPTDQRSSRFRNGPGRYATWGLRAPARCNTVLEGTIERAGDAGSLNLTVVRRIRAGQDKGTEELTCRHCGTRHVTDYREYLLSNIGSQGCLRCGNELISWNGHRDYIVFKLQKECPGSARQRTCTFGNQLIRIYDV